MMRTRMRIACPKCGGAVFPERQLGREVEYACLQCSKRLSPQDVAALLRVSSVASAKVHPLAA